MHLVRAPQLDIGQPIGGESLDHAVQAIAENKPGKAIQIFTRDMVGLPAGQSRMSRIFVGLSPANQRAPHDLATWRKIANPPQLNIDFCGGDMVKYHIEKTGPVLLPLKVPSAGGSCGCVGWCSASVSLNSEAVQVTDRSRGGDRHRR